MKNVTEYENCCGCGQCVEVCPLKAISMKKNKQGFFYPSVDKQKCVNCGRCISSCSFNNFEISKESVISSYAVKHKDESIRENSRSGGVFTAISDWILEHDGVIYGCELTNCREAIHTRAVTKSKRDKFRGSKYIQSNILDCFKSVKNDLENGRWVLFSGTPCQVDAIRNYCDNIKNDKLLLVDIVCHSVPSPKVWSDYLSYLSPKKETPVYVDFRDKQKFGWASHKEKIVYNSGNVHYDDLFARLFLSNLISRKDCFSCPYKSLSRCSDITIGDCWGVAENYSEFDDNKGVSLVLVNSKKGDSVFKELDNINSINVDIHNILQPALSYNWEIPIEYDSFWKYYYRHSFRGVLNKYIYKNPSLLARVMEKSKRTGKRIIRILKNK